MNIYKKPFFIFLFLSAIGMPLFSEVTPEQKMMLEQLPPDQRLAIEGKMSKANDLTEDIEDAINNEGLVERPDEEEDEEEREKKCQECIFGYDLFRFAPSTFAPGDIAHVSNSYTLGPGDELNVYLYGSQKGSKTAFISRDGTFNIPIIGTVSLGGLTFAEAKKFLKERIKKELTGTEISINLNRLRSINVYVLGEAYKPGSYTLSSLSTVTNALFLSGGVNKLGSLRNIEIKRRGKLVKKYDLYDLLIKGNTSTDIGLEDGDTIFIPFIENKVTLGGAFKRPFVYELLNRETLKDVIFLAGGFKYEVGFNPVIEHSTINRVSNKREISRIVYNSKTLNTQILNGDELNVSEISGLKSFSVKLTGEFKKPGVYTITQGDTVLDVVSKAGGYTKSAFVEGAVYLREEVAEIEKEAFRRSADNLEQVLFNIIQNGSLSISEFSLVPISQIIERLRKVKPIGRIVTSLDTLELKTDPYNNFEIRAGDIIHIPKRPSSVSVVGEVLKATSIKYLPEHQISDYLYFAGGLNDQADEDGIYIIGPNGQTQLYKRKYLGKNNIHIMPGSTIVVARDSKPWDAVSIAKVVTPILADLATSVAAVAAVNRY